MDESYVYKIKWARKEFIRKTKIKAFCEAEKEMIVRYMTVLTQLFVTMQDILLFYNFSDKDGHRIANWLSKRAPRIPRLCTLKKYGVQQEMCVDKLLDKKKRKFNTVAEDEVKRRNISRDIKKEKDDLLFVIGLDSILKVKVKKQWVRNSRTKKYLLSKLENCSQEEFEASTRDFYVGRSLIGKRKENDNNTNELRQEHRTRVLNDKWMDIYFTKAFRDKMDKKFQRWFSVDMKKANEIKVQMEEDQGESINFIHKYRDAVTNEV
jgi:hypothetical protein